MITDFPFILYKKDSQQGRDLATSGGIKRNSIELILFLYYEESLLSSNLNSKKFRFHGVRPNSHIEKKNPSILLNILV